MTEHLDRPCDICAKDLPPTMKQDGHCLFYVIDVSLAHAPGPLIPELGYVIKIPSGLTYRLIVCAECYTTALIGLASLVAKVEQMKEEKEASI